MITGVLKTSMMRVIVRVSSEKRCNFLFLFDPLLFALFKYKEKGVNVVYLLQFQTTSSTIYVLGQFSWILIGYS